MERTREQKKIRDFRREVAMLKSSSRKKYGFSYDSNEKYCHDLVDLGYGNILRLLSTNDCF